MYRYGNCLNIVYLNSYRIHCRRLLYSVLVQSCQCTLIMHDSFTKQLKERLHVAQNLDQRAHVGSEQINSIKLFKVQANHVYNNYNQQQAPPYILECVTRTRDFHQYNLRNSEHNLILQRAQGMSRGNFCSPSCRDLNFFREMIC